MRKWIDLLSESRLDEAKTFRANYEDLEDLFYLNPMLFDLNQMVARKAYRGLTDGKNVFVWDAETLIHHQAAWAIARAGMWQGDTFPALTDKEIPAPRYVPENSTFVLFDPANIAQEEINDPAWVQADIEDQDRLGIHSYRLASNVAVAMEDRGKAALMAVAPFRRLLRNSPLRESQEIETLTIDLPMLQARGIKRLLDKCVNGALGNLAYREEKVPLRRRYIVKGDPRIIAMLRRHIGKEDLNERALVPPTSYGYWIKPDGEIVPVDDSKHASVLYRYDIHDYDDAFRDGWVRCVCRYRSHHDRSLGKTFTLETKTGYMSVRTLSAIAAIAREPEMTLWQAEIRGKWQGFDDLLPFLAFVQSNRVRLPGKSPVLAESWFTTVKVGNKSIEVMKNPSRVELAKLLHSDPTVRAWATPTDIYAFPASRLTHFDIMHDLPVDFDRDARIFLDAEGPYLDRDTLMADVYFCPEDEREDSKRYTPDEFETAEQWKVLLANNPALRRLYGSYQVRKGYAD